MRGKKFPVEQAKCHPDRKHFAQGLCSTCYYRNWARKRRQKNPQRVKADVRRSLIKKAYGITPEEYDLRLSLTPVCCLCKRPFGNTKDLQPVLDHNHVTGALREFLHRRCNVALGLFNDDSALLRLAADYLERHNAL